MFLFYSDFDLVTPKATSLEEGECSDVSAEVILWYNPYFSQIIIIYTLSNTRFFSQMDIHMILSR